MGAFPNLPGMNTTTIDGGLTTTTTPTDRAVLVLGTAGQGQINQPYQMSGQSTAIIEFGTQGDLVRGGIEANTLSDNVILYRIGATPQTLTGIGLDITTGTASAGFSLAFGKVTPTSATDYTLWYKSGVLTVYYQGEIVYSNDPAASVDTGDITITGTVAGNNGLQLGTGTTYSLTAAITVQAASQLAGTVDQAAPTLTAAICGLNMTQRQLYVAVSEALVLLEGVQVAEIVVPSALADCPNVAYYVAGDATTAINNPATNGNALDWLKVTTDVNGVSTYTWAGVTVFSNAAARLTAGYHEVSFPYLLGNFCAQLEKVNQVCQFFIGTSVPNSLKLADVRTWLGALPTYADDGVTPTVQGRGLLGLPLIAGTTSIKLNTLCADYHKGFRLPGMFETEEGFYDGTVILDPVKNNPNNIGRFGHIWFDLAIASNLYGTNYVANSVAVVAGLVASLDPKVALTNQPLPLTQIPQLVYTPTQLNALSTVGLNCLRYKGTGKSPAALADYTMAFSSGSDFATVLRMNIHRLVIDKLEARADQYEGTSTLDGLQMVSMQTNLDQDFVNLNKCGYVSNPVIKIVTTLAQANLGKTGLYCTYHPADELIQINAFVGLSN